LPVLFLIILWLDLLVLTLATFAVVSVVLLGAAADEASRPKRIKAKKGRLRDQIMITRRINCSV
jgi:hypothetical protein